MAGSIFVQAFGGGSHGMAPGAGTESVPNGPLVSLPLCTLALFLRSSRTHNRDSEFNTILLIELPVILVYVYSIIILYLISGQAHGHGSDLQTSFSTD